MGKNKMSMSWGMGTFSSGPLSGGMGEPSVLNLTVQLLQSLTFSDNLSKKWEAIRTFSENVKYADSLVHKWDAKYIIGELMSLFDISYPRIVVIPISIPEAKRPGIPWIRLPIKKTIKVYGDVYHPTDIFITIEGDLVVRISLSKEVYGDLLKRFEKETLTIGDFVQKYGKSIQVIGDLTKQIDKVIVVNADLTKEILGNFDIKGKKDWKRFILEVLLEEEENGE